IRWAPTLKIWMTPFSSVAMLEKLALLRIAVWRAPVLSRVSWRWTSLMPSGVAAAGCRRGAWPFFLAIGDTPGDPAVFLPFRLHGLDAASHPVFHVGRDERFGDVLDRAQLDGALREVDIVLAGQDDDGQRHSGLFGCGQDFDARHPWHHHIQEHEPRPLGLDETERFLA